MAKRKHKKTNNKKKKTNSAGTLNTVTIVILVFIILFMTLSLLGYCGPIGNWLKSCILILFGTLGYFFPIVFLIQVLLRIFDRAANYKVYALLILYISIIGLVSIWINSELYSLDLVENIKRDIGFAQTWFSFDKTKFGAGVVVTTINFFAVQMAGKSGTILIWSVILAVSFLFTFGLDILKLVFHYLYLIVMLIPNLIKNYNQRKLDDIEIERKNEELIKKTLEKRKNQAEGIQTEDIEEIYPDDKHSNINHKKFDLFNHNKQVYDTSKIKLNPNDIQSRFFRVNDINKYDNYYDPNKDYNQNSPASDIKQNDINIDNKIEIEHKSNLLSEMKQKSINEIMSGNKDLSPESFFYTDKIEAKVNIDDYTKKIINQEYENNNNEVEKQRYEEDVVVETPAPIHNEAKVQYREGNDQNKPIIDTTQKPVIRRTNSRRSYKFPPLSYLNHSSRDSQTVNKSLLNDTANLLQMTLEQFGVKAKVSNVTVGPTVTRYEIQPELGVRVKKILELQDDIKLAIAATDIRIEAPIPGKSAIGIEVPNKETKPVYLGDILSSREFKEAKSKLTFAVGRDIGGKTILCDLQTMPHLLVAGSTGSGKSVCINSIIMSIIYKASPEDVRLIMVDPKVVELQVYNDIPHLLIPVVTDPRKAASALNWAVTEMMRRYNLMVETGLKDIDSYNVKIEKDLEEIKNSNKPRVDIDGIEIPLPTKLPKIVIIVDEFADLMMVASKEVEDAINRIAQLARACGIYLVIATQRPSVNVISGSIKTNVPGRIAFAVASGVDSRTILDTNGAEKLLGKGDMLYHPSGAPKAVRVQGCFVSEAEIKKVVEFIKDPNVVFDEEAEQKINSMDTSSNDSGSDSGNARDQLFVTAGKLCIEANTGTSGFLQRKLQIGFNRAARILDQLAEAGVVSEQDGKKPRTVLMTMEEFMSLYGE